MTLSMFPQSGSSPYTVVAHPDGELHAYTEVLRHQLGHAVELSASELEAKIRDGEKTDRLDLSRLIERGSVAWASVDSPTAWVEDQRGNP